MSSSEIAKLETRWQENPQGLTFAPLAEAYRKMREPARALEVLAEGLGRHPDYIPASIVLGRCHLDLGNGAEAEAAFRRVLELDDENAIALRALADLAEQQGRLAEAAGRLQELLLGAPVAGSGV
jgi:tetratricopeptide (TPR) repeat protein